jgi:hypothetical protein
LAVQPPLSELPVTEAHPLSVKGIEMETLPEMLRNPLDPLELSITNAEAKPEAEETETTFEREGMILIPSGSPL